MALKSLLFASVLSALAGCASLDVNPAFVVPAPDGAEEAIATVLRVYGRPDFHPVIHWYGEKAVDATCSHTCDDGRILHGFKDPDVGCIDGVSLGDETVLMAPTDATLRLDNISLAHELAHTALGVNGHPLAVFGVGGEFGCSENANSRVGDARAALVEAGL